MRPEYLVVHHSATKDGSSNDWAAIRRYHMSWRYQGNIISEAEGLARIANGIKGVEKPWLDIGYHFGIEQENGIYLWKLGRPLTMNGAHCFEQGMNRLGAGICVVGNFDVTDVPAEALDLLVVHSRELMLRYSILKDHVKRHSDYASYKTCPGTRFPWAEYLAAL